MTAGQFALILGVILPPAALAAGGGGEARWDLPAGDPGRGREAFRALGCLACHPVNGAGGRSAPDLAADTGRGDGPLELAGRLWNQGPRMWAAQTRAGARLPAVTPAAMADVFAYLFTMRQLGAPGDPGRGGSLFRGRQCSACHPGGKGKPDWPGDAFELTVRFWNHRQSAAGAGHPGLSFSDVFDLFAWLARARREPAGLPAAPDIPQPGAAEVFRAKGCDSCHHGSFSFERRHTRFGVTEVAFALWKHPPGRAERLTALEARAVAGYIAALQFFDESGSLERGAAVFEKKRCAACHDGGTAPAVASFRGAMTSYDMAAALWLHGPAMLAEMTKRGVTWPEFRRSEMADLVAFLHGARLRTRPAQERSIRSGSGSMAPVGP